jgi:hypothetical protein
LRIHPNLSKTLDMVSRKVSFFNVVVTNVSILKVATLEIDISIPASVKDEATGEGSITFAHTTFAHATFAHGDIYPEKHLPRKTFASKEICPDGRLPRTTFAHKDILRRK